MTGNKNLSKEMTRNCVTHKPVRPGVLDHLAQSIAEHEAMGRLLAGLATLKPLDKSIPDLDENLQPPDDVTL